MKSIILCLALFAFIECLEISPCFQSEDSNCSLAVEVGVYVESMCPWSKLFVNSQLFPTFTKLINSDPPIMRVNLVPFGKANMTFMNNPSPSLNLSCHHGDIECEGNILQSCAVINYDIEKSLPFVNCMYGSDNWTTPWIAAEGCSQQLNINFNDLRDCANSLHGIAFEYFMAGQTRELEPKLTYVPWITINGEHDDDINQKATTNLLKLICDTYTESVKPKECHSTTS